VPAAGHFLQGLIQLGEKFGVFLVDFFENAEHEDAACDECQYEEEFDHFSALSILSYEVLTASTFRLSTPPTCGQEIKEKNKNSFAGDAIMLINDKPQAWARGLSAGSSVSPEPRGS
jgi:hypothetical protein